MIDAMPAPGYFKIPVANEVNFQRQHPDTDH